MKKALVTGITGQDGAYLAEFLLAKGYEVHGIKRRASSFNTERIDHLYEDPHHKGRRLFLHYGDMTDSANIAGIMQAVQPDEIYNLAAQSHVAVSFETPEYTANVDGLGTLRILEAMRAQGLESDALLPGIDLRALRTDQGKPANRKHSISPAFALCRGEAVRLLDHRQLSRSVWNVCVQRHLVQSRVSDSRRDIS